MAFHPVESFHVHACIRPSFLFIDDLAVNCEHSPRGQVILKLGLQLLGWGQTTSPDLGCPGGQGPRSRLGTLGCPVGLGLHTLGRAGPSHSAFGPLLRPWCVAAPGLLTSDARHCALCGSLLLAKDFARDTFSPTLSWATPPLPQPEGEHGGELATMGAGGPYPSCLVSQGPVTCPATALPGPRPLDCTTPPCLQGAVRAWICLLSRRGGPSPGSS